MPYYMPIFAAWAAKRSRVLFYGKNNFTLLVIRADILVPVNAKTMIK
jgi:hypothetical protein